MFDKNGTKPDHLKSRYPSSFEKTTAFPIYAGAFVQR